MDNEKRIPDDKHGHAHKNDVLAQLKALVEHIQLIETLVSDERPCLTVLSQLSGVATRLAECRKTVAHDHIQSCLRSALQPGQEKILHEIESILNQALKGPSQGSFH